MHKLQIIIALVSIREGRALNIARMMKVFQLLSLTVLALSQAVSADDQCIPGTNETFLEDSMCYLQTCDGGVPSITAIGCAESDTCKIEGSSYFKYGCQLHVCAKIPNNNTVTFISIYSAIYCPDYKGDCHEPSEEFLFKINGILMDKCRCFPRRYSIESFKCFGKHVTLPVTTLPPGGR